MLTAVPDPGSYFVGWGADCDSTIGRKCYFWMDRQRLVTAEFALGTPPPNDPTPTGQDPDPIPPPLPTPPPPPPAPPQDVEAPRISGTPTVGFRLFSTTGSWKGYPTPTFAREWLRCQGDGSGCNTIDGASGAQYVLTPADENKRIRVRVTATNTQGSSSAESEAPGALVAPAALENAAPDHESLPTVEGFTVAGETLTASAGSWSGRPEPSFSFQWWHCDSDGCHDIAGANEPSYRLVPHDVGTTVSVVVTASNTEGSASAESEQSSVIASAPIPLAPPAITGPAKIGALLTASHGSWVAHPAPSFAYRWERCNSLGTSCSPLAGMTQATYVVVAADAGKRLRVAVTASNGVGSPASNRSSPTAVVPPTWDTRLLSKPLKITRATRATFSWSALRDAKKLVGGFKSQCRLDNRLWTACSPGKTYERLTRGTHTFRVRAGNGGAWDTSPAVYTWRVRR